MEIKINKEICAYNETLFFGLSARQFVCSVLAVATAVGVYFVLEKFIGKETSSWLCMVAASPMAAMGFFKYNGLTTGKLAWAFIKSEFLYAGKRVFKTDNYYLDLLNSKPKKEVVNIVEIFKKQHSQRKGRIKNTKKRSGFNTNRKNIQ